MLVCQPVFAKVAIEPEYGHDPLTPTLQRGPEEYMVNYVKLEGNAHGMVTFNKITGHLKCGEIMMLALMLKPRHFLPLHHAAWTLQAHFDLIADTD